ncbi:MAG TPA: hypothetical protein VIG99_22800 [Myxococcaceae bacterium]|jgi:hypothetical protein
MADPNPAGARPGAGRPLTAGQRPTGPAPAADPAPLLPDVPAAPPAAAAPRSSGSKAGPAVSAARPPLGASPPVASNPRISAEIQARTSGLKLRSQPQDVKQRLREGALDTVLNAAGLLADTWDDFRNRDRYFKYKAGIIAAWLFLTVTSFSIAFPGTGSNHLSAHLIQTEVAGRPVYMIKNDSRSAWREVTVVVNKHYRTAVGTVEPNGGTLTFNLKQLKGDKDTAAPVDMRIQDLELRTDDGDVWLIKDGEERK